MDFGYNNASIFGQHSFLSEKCGGNAHRIGRPFSRSARERVAQKAARVESVFMFLE